MYKVAVHKIMKQGIMGNEAKKKTTTEGGCIRLEIEKGFLKKVAFKLDLEGGIIF